MNIIKLKKIISEEIRQTLSELDIDTYTNINKKGNDMNWSNKSVMDEFDITMFKQLQQSEKQNAELPFVSEEYKDYYFKIKYILEIYKEHGYESLSQYQKKLLQLFKKSKGGNKAYYLRSTSKALAERLFKKYINKTINFETQNKSYEFNISKININNHYSYLNDLEVLLELNGNSNYDRPIYTLKFDKDGERMNINRNSTSLLQFDIDNIEFSKESVSILYDILKTAKFEIPEKLK